MRLPALMAVVLLCACNKTTLVIESDTSWAGSIDGVGQVADRGDARFELPNVKQENCWELRKTSSAGTLRAYAEDDTWFGLGSEVADGVVRLWVADSGPGIPDDLKGHVLERFGRGVVTAEDEGFGLGLSIVRAIAEAHAGHVTVSDTDPGAPRPGATVTLHLPQEHPWPAS